MASLKLLVLGLVIHATFLISVFDIYFNSPIVHGILPQKNDVPTPAKRVVVISVDGLRYDGLSERNTSTKQYVTPHIQSIIASRGVLGLSLCHLPTESRPGHVAMLAGFYEDPSAVTKGWKENPVDFDSIFNQSVCSFAWGAPSILNIFYKGLDHDCMLAESFDEEQNFAGNTMLLDNWVLNKAQESFKKEKNRKVFHKEKSFFFFHLLGQDTSGHTHKPHSERYKKNLHNVDRIVNEIEKLFIDYFQDDKTSYVLTSDHGMTPWGSHGAGDPTETNTPILTWGAGLRKEISKGGVTINQADITPLIAILLGVPIPVNSIGTLPIEFLDWPDENIAKAILLNSKQIAEQFKRKLKLVKQHSQLRSYKPFKRLILNELPFKILDITNEISQKKFADAIFKSKALIKLTMEGIDYYHNYYQSFLLFLITASYIAWMCYLLLQLSGDINVKLKNTRLPEILLAVIIVITIVLLQLQHLPFSFYLYCILPEFLWYLVIINLANMDTLMKCFKEFKSVTIGCIVLIGAEILVAAFFYRWVLSLSLLGILVWSKFSNMLKSSSFTLILWYSSGVGLSIFTFLPVIGGSPKSSLILISGTLLTLFAALCIFYTIGSEGIPLSFCRCFFVAAATWNSVTVHDNFTINNELSLLNQCFSWTLSAAAFLVILIKHPQYIQRLQVIFMSLSILLILLSVSHEGLFLLILYIHMFCWVKVETATKKLNDTNPKSNNLSDFRQAYFFLSYVWIAFFGVGNIASINSFDPAWVRCFVTTFYPFLMTFLILFKTVIPLLAVACTMRVIAVTLNVKPERLFLIVLIYCNVMGLQFLYLIKNKGSWLDIGSSISHYVIQLVVAALLVLFYGLAQLLIPSSVSDYEPIPSFVKKSEISSEKHNSFRKAK